MAAPSRCTVWCRICPTWGKAMANGFPLAALREQTRPYDPGIIRIYVESFSAEVFRARMAEVVAGVLDSA
ncbi:hypothetical protein ACL02S_01455 [Nocardia sp. 004]|uniref:hypothetical protein n=1 Tax=Nocardia sp. 004 TaxID=3385978 RepID=UPI00399F8663